MVMNFIKNPSNLRHLSSSWEEAWSSYCLLQSTQLCSHSKNSIHLSTTFISRVRIVNKRKALSLIGTFFLFCKTEWKGHWNVKTFSSNLGNLPLPKAITTFFSMTFSLSEGLQGNRNHTRPGYQVIVLRNGGNGEFPQRFHNILFLILSMIFGFKLGFQAISWTILFLCRSRCH